jgi:glycosyltransferase involved in cell wall biosynthesis
MVKVCHISTAHPTFDGRIFHKECVFLSNAGFDVSLVITHSKNEVVDGVKIKGLKTSNGRLSRILIKPWKALFVAVKTKSDIYHFHDPELMFIGVILSLLGKKVIFDSHENVSSQIESKKWLGSLFVRKVIKSIYRLFEKFCILFYTRVISVTPEIVNFLSEKKGVLIRNYPILSKIENATFETNDTSTLVLLYVGGLTKIRGIKEACYAVGEVDRDVKLVLVGKWSDESYKTECLAISTKVEYLGLKPLDEVYKIMKTADVGIATLYPEKNYLNSLPIKAFEYMTCGLPMIMSNFPYWIKEFDVSSVFVNPMEVDDITKAIVWLVDHKSERLQMGKDGKRVVYEKFSWEAESLTLIKTYNELVKK